MIGFVLAGVLLVIWASVLVFAVASPDAPDPAMAPSGMEVAGGLRFIDREVERKKNTAESEVEGMANAATAPWKKDEAGDDTDTDEEPDEHHGIKSPHDSTDMLEAEMPVVYIVWTAVLIGLLLNLLLFSLYVCPALYRPPRLKEGLEGGDFRSSRRWDESAQTWVESDSESRHAAGDPWQAQMRNLIAGWNLVPFCLLLLAGYRLTCFIQGLEQTDDLRAKTATLFQRSDSGCSTLQSHGCHCTITQVYHAVRVLESKGISDCDGASKGNVFLRIGAGNWDDVAARCQVSNSLALSLPPSLPPSLARSRSLALG